MKTHFYSASAAILVTFATILPHSAGAFGLFYSPIRPLEATAEHYSSTQVIIHTNDTIRMSDLRSIQNALELYAEEHGGYPNRSGCADNILGRLLEDYFTNFPDDPGQLRTTTVVTNTCGSTILQGGYGYIALNTDTTNSLAEGYLLVSRLESTSLTGDQGVYYNTTPWTATITGSNATGSYNLADATQCTATTTACTASVHRYFMLGSTN